MLSRPNYDPQKHIETICDKDGFVANVWRSLQFDPDEVAKWCDWPVNHADLVARRARLIENEDRILQNLVADDTWFDAKLAGYWIWAASCWIGSGLTRVGSIPHLSNTGKGVHNLSQRPHLSDAGIGVHNLSKRSHLSNTGKGVQEPYNENIYVWFRSLSERLRNVRVVCGDWTRVCGGNWQDKMGNVGIFFDPPYSDTNRDTDLYHHDSIDVAKEVCKWALERGSKPTYRIVIAGYDSEHEDLIKNGWTIKRWKAGNGYAKAEQAKVNCFRECFWLSPHCLKNDLFDEIEPTEES